MGDHRRGITGDDTLEAMQKPTANELRIEGGDEAPNTLLKFELSPPGQWYSMKDLKQDGTIFVGVFNEFLSVPLGNRCCVHRFFSSCGSWASPCGGSSCCRVQAPGRGLSGCGTQA